LGMHRPRVQMLLDIGTELVVFLRGNWYHYPQTVPFDVENYALLLKSDNEKVEV
jgi:hypothetical protein